MDDDNKEMLSSTMTKMQFYLQRRRAKDVNITQFARAYMYIYISSRYLKCMCAYMCSTSTLFNNLIKIFFHFFFLFFTWVRVCIDVTSFLCE